MEPTPRLDPTTRIALEALWRALLGVIPLLARALGRPNPLETRADKRAARHEGAGFAELS